MIWRWMLRVGLTLGAFFMGTLASFFLLMLITWDLGVIDVVTTLTGLAVAAFTFTRTRRLTQPPNPTEP